ncbi:MAG: hypothetical protein IPP77_07195 [Bacteroidetes bacterium]|nr:hypothetical protein [Bacteroidota bacterium]
MEQLFKDNSSGDLNSIAPSITEMSNRMNNIKIRSDEMVKKLETIETRWKKIKTKIGT